ncbi:glycerol-3-phosphate dehydrogenase [Oharaeibacter diazotrophicus]|uniref:Glycerol-3-phosphate dehydrogenase n=2 Tax=Oharaeibacter diazotrophicus TaxID=1920512 RepID=A0A4R6R6J1_9HYPH|nr:glycerol-3-phosphate dehydrogenase [Oharaeibacter diazotrophicus]TDP81560.1 homodimeric glycerol 3-phosphate dehydrogenase (quinone) [Oharaeibacter diazotrophicus]BBE73798.1 aerobic glycerol-3-phosphate dehydrogenase [Pleomorphomonas sp. SM30]GLS75589.1 glycerol-3-phosphate dehydrogenase [Oharaeibacter diazotrophicus]
MADVDVLIVGGGINGCGVARDAVGRGYSVLLAEQNDLASGTSSWSTKLIHGGLRYLEHYEFRLVREALQEREVLWRLAPHIIRPLRFVLPHHRGLRPAWLLRLGLFLYDHLGGRKLLPPTRTLDLSRDETGRPLKPGFFTRGFEYSDCWVEDTRLVVLNARDAADRGATILTRTRVATLAREGDVWRAVLEDRATGARRVVTAKMVVNAAGPWVDEVLRGPLGRNDARNVRLVQGSHIVVKRVFDHDRAYIFQNADGRIIFAIPYEGSFTLIGTTDRDWTGDPADVAITDGEIDYLLAAAGEYFAKPIGRSDIVWSYSGVRPLYDDGASKAQEATRDYVLKVDGADGAPRLVNVFGGKITTYRRLAESVLEKIEEALGRRGKGSWTGGAALPGGDFLVEGFEALVAELGAAHPGVTPALVRRLARAYGTEARRILAGARADADLGRGFGAGLTEAEVRHLVEREWARTADDVLWRRSKLGLTLPAEGRAALEEFLGDARLGVAAQ